MYQRIITPQLQRLATQYPVITLTGPRQSGKTTLCQSTFPHHEYANLEALATRDFANQDPQGFLAQFKGGAVLSSVLRSDP